MITSLLSDYHQIIKQLITPNKYHSTLWNIDLEILKLKGFSYLILDVDDTILALSQRKLSLQQINWIHKCKDLNFEVYLLSNNRNKKRIQSVCDQIQVNGYYYALKPLPFSLKYLSKQFSIPLSKSVIIGDQLLKDTLLANWSKVYNILVSPLERSNGFFITLQRRFELFLINKFDIITSDLS